MNMWTCPDCLSLVPFDERDDHIKHHPNYNKYDKIQVPDWRYPVRLNQPDNNDIKLCEHEAMHQCLLEFVKDFELDYVWEGEIVDNPNKIMVALYKKAKKIISP
jgi:hypothetical protein